jgi:hypothetical protein
LEVAQLSKKPARNKPANKLETTEAVDDYMRQLEHPLKPVLEAVRKLVLGIHADVREGIKWNAPSFHYRDYFATTGVRSPDFVHVVLHTGAKTKASAATGVDVADPTGLLEWHAKDRCSVKFFDMKDFKAKKTAFEKILAQWVKQMERW